MFNQYVWQIYLKAGGREIADMFERNLTRGFTKEYLDIICELRDSYCPLKDVIWANRNQLSRIIGRFKNILLNKEENDYTINIAMYNLYSNIKSRYHYTSKMIFEHFCYYIDYLTTFLSIKFPDLFIPYYFQYNFNVFEKIALEFEIDLPPIPMKKDYEGRFYYYGEICEAMLNFREKNNMTPYELCAFLYDFAPKYIGGTDSYIIKDLPEPKSAYFIGGSKDDAFLSDKDDSIVCWQCNPDTKAGDIIVMYLRTPISAVDSVWRSVSIGFNDPFFYYYRCTYISKPKSINRVTQKQLQQDDIFKELPIVRKNMQGINGVELRPSEYNHLMDIAGADVPRLEFTISDNDLIFTNEKDVENKLIKPFISKLGYSETEYQQQLYIEIGNHNHALIPDFAVLPKLTRGHQSAYFLIEAKLSITTLSMLEETKIQARSYAKMLNVKYSVIISKEKIWITSPDDDYSDDIFSATWEELDNADVFSSLYKILGKNK